MAITALLMNMHRPSYLNIRTGEVHSLHPNLHGVQEQLQQQRAAAEQQLHQRIARVRSYALGVREAAGAREQEILAQLLQVMQATAG